MKRTHLISPKPLTMENIRLIVSRGSALGLAPASEKAIRKCRRFLEKKLEESDHPYYGINTGYGALCNVQISESEIESLQYNLVQSHATGMGEEVPAPIVRLIILLKIKSLAKGYSGVRLLLVEQLLQFYNKDILPVIYQLGSLGASGDLAPLAHLALGMMGKGRVRVNGTLMNAEESAKAQKWTPIRFLAKEGLAMLNGTQFSTAYALYCLLEGFRLFRLANLCGAISIEAFNCRSSPFHELTHEIRPHRGQKLVAHSIRDYIKGSKLAALEKTAVQDPYAFRCIPQVHGASYDALVHAQEVIMTEINSVTDNPNIFPDDNVILSGGNFHAQPIALVLDYMAIALAELGSISERRVFQLISGQRALPGFLIKNAGLHSGMMMPQYTAASIVSQNKQLCTPASVDSIVSSNGQEDHVSMAANAGTKAFRVVKNLERLLAIEFMVAAQAIEFRRPLRSSTIIEQFIYEYRQRVPSLEHDRILSNDMLATVDFLKEIEL